MCSSIKDPTISNTKQDTAADVSQMFTDAGREIQVNSHTFVTINVTFPSTRALILYSLLKLG